MILELSASTRRSVADYQQYKARATRSTRSDLRRRLKRIADLPHLAPNLYAPAHLFCAGDQCRATAGSHPTRAALQGLYRQFPNKLDQQGRLAYQQRKAAALKDRVTAAWRAYALPQVDDL